MTTTPPAGWYDDPATPGLERYFDGANWTDRTQPTASAPAQPAVQLGGGYVNCGMHGTLQSKQSELTTKKRSKFGLIWILVCVFSVGLGLIAYLLWPRHKEVIGVDRYNQCSNCGTRQ